MLKRRIGVFAPRSFKLVEGLIKKLPTHEICEIDFPGIDQEQFKIDLSQLTSEEHRQVLEKIDSHEIIVADSNLVVSFMNEIKNPKWIQGTWTGIDMMAVHPDARLPYIYTRLGGCYNHHLAEYALAHIINMERNTQFFYGTQKQCKWARGHKCDGQPYRLLSALTITILGVGDIGRTLAYHCKQFGMTVYGMVSSIPETKNENVDEFFTSESLTDFLGRSDYVCNVLPKTSKTNSLLSNGVLKHCEQRGSVFVNIGRGNVIRDDEIVDALERKWIRGAVLDVFENEPLREDHKLWNMENVVITPHVAGLLIRSEFVDAFRDNLQLYEAGKPLKYVVDWKREY